jgi:subtilisin-like proprotein convertase family protein
VTFAQKVDGIESFDSYLRGNVTKNGRLINVTGSPVGDLSVPTATPALTADDALLAARDNVGGDDTLPPVEKRSTGPQQKTTYETYAESAKLTVFAEADRNRLAWEVQVLDADDILYRVVVDAASGKVLVRQSLTAFDSNDADVWPLHPSKLVAPKAVNFGTDPTWLDRSAANGNQLIGNNTHTYSDTNGTNGYQAGEETTRNGGTNWKYPMTWYNQAECPAFGCTWDSTSPASKTVNQKAGAVGLFYLTNHFHDALLEAPIGFDEASRNFEQVNSSGQGVGGDAVLAEAQDSGGLNNANFATPADGSPGRMQMYLWSGSGPAPSGPQYDVDGSASADVVYHEYAHGLSNRLVGNGGGLTAFQSQAMGEGWSDFYALDLLVHEGDRTDPAGPGDVWLGEYVTGVPGIFGGLSRIRHQAIDCTVGANAAKCPASGTAGPGGYTFGDLGKVGTNPGSVHDSGEIWQQTMWDLRDTLGRNAALKIVTGGMRLSPNAPSMLAMRDAILQSAQVNGVNVSTVWSVFANRGMGFFASTPSASATTATEDFSLPPSLLHVSTDINDNAPRGDGDGIPEPGETLTVATTLQNLTGSTISGLTGTLAADNGVLVTRGSAGWPAIGAGQNQKNDPSFAATVPMNKACGTDFTLTVSVNGPDGPVTIPAKTMTVGGPLFTDATDVPKAIPDNLPAGVNSTFTFPGNGTVTDLDVKIGQLTHTYVGDLKITLSHGATTVVLMNRPGAGTYGAPGDNFVDLILDDEASSPIEDIPAANPPGGYTGSYTPDELLSAFDGQSLSGTWTLNVSDSFAGDTGTLAAWGMSPTPQCDVFGLPESVTNPVSGVTTSAATLNGSHNSGGKATDYRFEYGTTNNYGEQSAVTAGGAGNGPVPVSTPLSGLTPATEYHYRLIALRDGVVLSKGADQSFVTAQVLAESTPPPDTTAPAVQITKKPKKKVVTKKAKIKVKVKFTSEPGAAFQCKVDKKKYKPCTSPYKVKVKSKPRKGQKHTILIRATDQAGNVGKVAKVKFKVVRK